MRIPKYLSPSALAKWEESREEYYKRYLCPFKTARPPQFDFMAVGSGFDALVKNRIHVDIFGSHATQGTEFELDTIFEAQVEAHIRDETLPRAKDLFEQYIDSGSYPALIKDIQLSPFAPEMEFTVEGEIQGITFLGKPDLRYVTKGGVHVICDWKVNGSTSKIGASPFKGYQIVRDAYRSTTHGKFYRARRLKTDPADKVYDDYRGEAFRDVMIQDTYLEDKCDYWADQLAIYSWLLGEPVGSEEFVVRMEQIACRPVTTRDLPRAKFATHINRISKRYQEQIIHRAHDCWNIIRSGHIFTDMSRGESSARCDMLDAQAQVPKGLYPALSAAGTGQYMRRSK